MIHIYQCLSQFEWVFAGIERLRQCFKNIKRQYCGDDEEAWRESCKAAFDDNTAKLLEEKEWTLNDLDPEDFE